ncbi:ankyrin repeat domain-containing protein [Basilea psittacipulmonis]|uniref:Uncharacterized protein n=1 Tax=Basilea psittacipulmonis DSM 24701 TaxID=1072685 RepID=A0A077DGR1_9BURK|nr:ankyrin repeat domain-containing protein [Basilea psittacipulmonis]AIL32647.1 hypothetical protein IX83_04390 [Basilea psittacipulmonis DSM 24701]
MKKIVILVCVGLLTVHHAWAKDPDYVGSNWGTAYGQSVTSDFDEPKIDKTSDAAFIDATGISEEEGLKTSDAVFTDTTGISEEEGLKQTDDESLSSQTAENAFDKQSKTNDAMTPSAENAFDKQSKTNDVMTPSATIQDSTKQAFRVAIRNNRYQDVARMIQQYPKIVNTVLPDGQTPLQEAIIASAWNSYEQILNARDLNINTVNQFGETALMYVSIIGDLKRTQQLIKKGAMIDNWGWNAVHYAVIKKHPKVLAYLLEQHPWVDAPTPDGSTALLLAVEKDCDECALQLFVAGADPYLKNSKGVSAFDQAKARNNQKMINIFDVK